jgi:hypothetical protein
MGSRASCAQEVTLMVTDSAVGGGRRLDRLEAVFDDERVVANAGVLLASTLSDRLGLEALVDECVVLGDRSAGRGRARRCSRWYTRCCSARTRSTMHDLLRAGETSRVLGHRVLAPSMPMWRCRDGRSHPTKRKR